MSFCAINQVYIYLSAFIINNEQSVSRIKHALILVDLAQLTLVRALELPELSLSEADKSAALDVSLIRQLIVLLQILSYALLLEHTREVERLRRMRKFVVRGQTDAKVQVSEEE